MAMLTESGLRRLIKEELKNILSENFAGATNTTTPTKTTTPTDAVTHIVRAVEIFDKYTEVTGDAMKFSDYYDKAYNHLKKAIQLSGGNLQKLNMMQENKK